MTLHYVICHVGSTTTEFVTVEVWAPSRATAEALARAHGYVPARQ